MRDAWISEHLTFRLRHGDAPGTREQEPRPTPPFERGGIEWFVVRQANAGILIYSLWTQPRVSRARSVDDRVVRSERPALSAEQGDNMKYANFLLVLVSSAITYAILEVALYFALCFGLSIPAHPYFNYVAFTNPRFFVDDPVIGWRLRPGEANSSIRIMDGEVQYAAEDVIGNSAGFHSRLKYTPQKGRSYRIAVYGDSYTAMQYQSKAWPDRLHDELKEAGIEVYGFGFDGGGIANWYQHYFHELVSRYDFDMVVFAVCCNDLRRSFAVWSTRPDGGYFGGFGRAPADEAEFAAEYLPRLTKLVAMTDRRVIRELRTHFSKHHFMLLPVDLYLLRTVKIALNSLVTINGPPPINIRGVYSGPVGPIDTKLEEIILDLKRRGKTAVLLFLPWRSEVNLAQSSELAEVAKRYCIHFLDGFELFKNETAARPEYPYRPRLDPHWLEPASERFAEILAPKIQRLKAAAAPHCADGG